MNADSMWLEETGRRSRVKARDEGDNRDEELGFLAWNEYLYTLEQSERK